MIIVDEIVSADGVAARADGSIDFFVGREGLVDSVGDAERMSRVRSVLLGAKTYREFSAHWPTQAPTLDVNRLPKHVLSRTIERAPWGDGEFPPATVEHGDAADVALGLEQRYEAMSSSGVASPSLGRCCPQPQSTRCGCASCPWRSAVAAPSGRSTMSSSAPLRRRCTRAGGRRRVANSSGAADAVRLRSSDQPASVGTARIAHTLGCAITMAMHIRLIALAAISVWGMPITDATGPAAADPSGSRTKEPSAS
jgi:hypothetical protein